jgi:hypothetical protein
MSDELENIVQGGSAQKRGRATAETNCRHWRLIKGAGREGYFLVEDLVEGFLINSTC